MKGSYIDLIEEECRDTINKYMPSVGEGNTIASQACTAVNKLVYKWFNDGDVYDNTYGMCGWSNDLSSYANWLYRHVPGAVDILDRIAFIRTDIEYEKLLYDICRKVTDGDWLKEQEGAVKDGSIYDWKDGPFEYEEPEEED